MTDRTCAIRGCTRRHEAKGLCAAHYKQARQEHVKRATCAECGTDYQRRTRRTHVCPPCAALKLAEANARRQRERTHFKTRTVSLYCSTCTICARSSWSKWRRKYCSRDCRYASKVAKSGCWSRTCRSCLAPLGRTRDFLCADCKRTAKRESNARAKATGRLLGKAWASDRNHRQRARAFGVDYEPINKRAIYERDGWVCGICRKPVAKSKGWPHPKSPSLDHIVPMSKGGDHRVHNVQCAHLACNTIKGNDDEVQLLLIV